MVRIPTLTALLTAGLAAGTAFGGEPIPDRLVVLTFDDSVKSHATVAELEEQLQAIDDRCAEHGIPKPTSFAWPGNVLAPEALAVLRGHGIRFARRGGAPEYPYDEGRGCAYEPGRDHPLLVPSAGDARPDWTLEDFTRAVRQATDGRIAVLQFHGVPEGEHPWVHTPRERFEEYMRYLHDNDYQVVALRDLERWVDADVLPEEPWRFIETRPCGPGGRGRQALVSVSGPSSRRSLRTTASAGHRGVRSHATGGQLQARTGEDSHGGRR